MITLTAAERARIAYFKNIITRDHVAPIPGKFMRELITMIERLEAAHEAYAVTTAEAAKTSADITHTLRVRSSSQQAEIARLKNVVNGFSPRAKSRK